MSDVTDIKGVNVKTIPSYSFTTFFHQGHGTEDDPFTIYTPAQLACLDLYSRQAYFYKQMEDLDLSSYANWDPIGSIEVNGYSTNIRGFYGRYNGNNKKISNAVINYPDDNYAGLFVSCSSGSISNIRIENFAVTGKQNVGCLCGSNYATISNVVCDSVNVNGSREVGCLVGYLISGIIENCSVTNSTVSGTEYNIGGCVGKGTNSTLNDIRCEGVTVGGTTFYTGGCIGSIGNSNATQIYCGNSSVLGTRDIGGCIGNITENSTVNGAQIENIYVKAGNYNCGGFAGYVQQNSSFTDITCNDVIVEGNSSVGGAFGSVKNCTVTTCNVTNSTATGSYYIGGCAGTVNNNSIFNEIRCEGLIIKATNSDVGGCVGQAESNSSFTDITCDDINVEGGKDEVGCAFGSVSNGTVTTCSVTNSTASGTRFVGGCVGQAKKSSYTDITCNDVNVGGNYGVGCAFGYVYDEGTITTCSVTNSTASGTTNVGGCVGNGSSSTLNGAHCEHLIVKSTGSTVGGCVGYDSKGSYTDITCNDVNVEGGNNEVGCAFGFVNNGTITTCSVTNSFASGTTYVGGCIGETMNDTNISGVTCDNVKVNGKSRVGGAIGELYKGGTITTCSITNSAASGTSDVGGCVGYGHNSTLNGIHCEHLIVKATDSAVGGCVGTAIGSYTDITCNDVKVEGNSNVGGALGFVSTGTISLCYVTNSSSIGQSSGIGGLIGKMQDNSTLDKCFVDNTFIKGRYWGVAGLVGSSLSSSIDSCYITDCSIEFTDNNYYDAGLVGRSTDDISNCYMYNCTVTGYDAYGAIVGFNEGEVIKDCFVSQNHDKLINTNNGNAPVNCYYNVNDLASFTAGPWSEGAWSNFDTSVFPPKLTDLPEP